MTVAGEPAPDHGRAGPPDRCCRRADPELSEFALDPHTAPATVLSAEPYDELHDVRRQGRSTRSTLASPPPPFPGHGVAVPAQQGVRGDQERDPAAAGKQSAEHSKQRPVGRAIAQATVQLSLQDPNLVAQYQKFDVFLCIATSPTDDDFQDPAQTEPHQRERHSPRSCHPGTSRARPTSTSTGWLTPRSEYWRPSARARLPIARRTPVPRLAV
jgi:hypothetical protein